MHSGFQLLVHVQQQRQSQGTAGWRNSSAAAHPGSPRSTARGGWRALHSTSRPAERVHNSPADEKSFQQMRLTQLLTTTALLRINFKALRSSPSRREKLGARGSGAVPSFLGNGITEMPCSVSLIPELKRDRVCVQNKPLESSHRTQRGASHWSEAWFFLLLVVWWLLGHFFVSRVLLVPFCLKPALRSYHFLWPVGRRPNQSFDVIVIYHFFLQEGIGQLERVNKA